MGLSKHEWVVSQQKILLQEILQVTFTWSIIQSNVFITFFSLIYFWDCDSVFVFEKSFKNTKNVEKGIILFFSCLQCWNQKRKKKHTFIYKLVLKYTLGWQVTKYNKKNFPFLIKSFQNKCFQFFLTTKTWNKSFSQINEELLFKWGWKSMA